MAVVLTVGTNSWVTLVEANAYLEEKWGASAWASLTDSQKSQLLITGYRWINQKDYIDIPASSTNTKVKYAQIELAFYCYNYYAEHEKRRALYAQGVRDFSISKYSETLEASDLPDFIKNLLKDFIVDEGGYFPVMERDFE